MKLCSANNESRQENEQQWIEMKGGGDVAMQQVMYAP